MTLRLLVLSLITPFISLYGQEIPVKATPVLRFLFQSRDEIPEIHKFPSTCFPFPEFRLIPTKIRFDTKLIKTNKGLFAVQDGSGVVLKANRLYADSLYFERLDSTAYFGYNFGAIKFNFKDTIFSFGGYGYFRKNGHLLFFSQAKEWDILSLDTEVPATAELYYFNLQEKVLYFLQYPYTNESVRENLKDYTLFSLDLSKKTIEKKGVLISDLHDIKDARFTLNSKALNGIIIFLRNELLLANPSSNSLYKISKTNKTQKLFQAITNNCGCIFESNGVIYFNFHEDLYPDSVIISKNDLTYYSNLFTTNNTITKPKRLFQLITILLSVSLLFIVFFYIIYSPRMNDKGQNEEINESEPHTSGSNNDNQLFSILEQELITKIQENSLKNKITTTEEINSYLGLKKKSGEIQKKVRTETINRINIKFKINSKTNQDLIIRSRSHEDKRFFNYFINNDSLPHYYTLINRPNH